MRMYIFGRDVLLKIEGYNYRNGEPTDFRYTVTIFGNMYLPIYETFFNSDHYAVCVAVCQVIIKIN